MIPFPSAISLLYVYHLFAPLIRLPGLQAWGHIRNIIYASTFARAFSGGVGGLREIFNLCRYRAGRTFAKWLNATKLVTGIGSALLFMCASGWSLYLTTTGKSPPPSPTAASHSLHLPLTLRASELRCHTFLVARHYPILALSAHPGATLLPTVPWRLSGTPEENDQVKQELEHCQTTIDNSEHKSPGATKQLEELLKSAWKDQLAVAFLILLTMIGEILTVDHDAAQEQRLTDSKVDGSLSEHILSADDLGLEAYAEA